MDIGLYNKNRYRIGKFTDISLHLLSKIKDEGFIDFINSKGIKVENKFIKDIPIHDLEDAYELNCKVIYKGREFDVSSSMANMIKTNKLIIGTLDYPLSEELGGFERVDKYYYEKEVGFYEIDKFNEVKKPLFHFKNTKSVTTREIPKDEIIKYALYIESFA
ncbi:MAG: hypothetical protein GYA50_10190 [Eubacteriaceae bacterium]|nr:hypothetical protein [Eubacteriaceae bacterium]